MQYSIRHTTVGWPALTIAVAAASALLLLVFSARAPAEGINPVGAISSAAVGGGSASAQATPPPAPEAAASEPVEAAEPEASLAAESEPPATPSAASPATPPHPSTAHLPSTADLPTPDVRAVSNAPKDDTAVPSTDQALELARTARQVTTKATTTIVQSAKSTAEAVDRVAPVDHLHTLSLHPLQMASGALQMARSALPSGVKALAVPEGVEDLRSANRAPLEVGADAFSPPVASAIPRTATAGFRGRELAISLDNSSIRHLLDLAGVEPLPSGVPGVSTSSSPGRPGMSRANLGDVSATPVDKRLADFAPLDGNAPQPAPGSPQNEAGGAGSTSFIPIAALLALLALAAPVICRRLGEAPDLRPQTPFVCALERPG